MNLSEYENYFENEIVEKYNRLECYRKQFSRFQNAILN